jgi:hypothetical protein
MTGWGLTAVFAVVGQLLLRSWAAGILIGWILVFLFVTVAIATEPYCRALPYGGYVCGDQYQSNGVDALGRPFIDHGGTRQYLDPPRAGQCGHNRQGIWICN